MAFQGLMTDLNPRSFAQCILIPVGGRSSFPTFHRPLPMSASLMAERGSQHVEQPLNSLDCAFQDSERSGRAF